MSQNHSASNTTTAVNGPELTVTRLFKTSRELVFKTWTEAEHLQQWWGPEGFTITIQQIDVKPGGVWSYIMHGPDGVDYDNKISYLEVVSPERLVYAHGDHEDAEHFRVTVTFVEQDGETELTMHSLFKSAEELEKVVKEYGAIEGAKSTLERLAQQLATLV
ncbi:Uncharacterized conserved protein YndB, AHSA1/START domain [Paenibacillus algorifonticola]|uniref:Uncharacterized conserved protein YndB, AHSA1/START domain n=1 Tax=Paenibacillus algorifonticola TaxID=684063 RepID=A0A1I2J297_9BACL|nr:SRPBCC family protein [Paenibacillus algorifonticola]SFF48120.1 Uncharacterized conserved protein YndB, AHSA1/START domain [Paenibacillus algorifonticola]